MLEDVSEIALTGSVTTEAVARDVTTVSREIRDFSKPAPVSVAEDEPMETSVQGAPYAIAGILILCGLLLFFYWRSRFRSSR